MEVIIKYMNDLEPSGDDSQSLQREAPAVKFQSSHDLIKASYLTLEPSLESSTKLKLKLNPKKHEMHDAESK